MENKLEKLYAKKEENQPITMLTAYDFPTAQIEDETGVDSILVGDSVGTNVLGYSSEQEVTMADMLHHTAAAARGVKRAYLITDMPFGAAENKETALSNASQLIGKGAECVKIEGWSERKEIVTFLSEKGIPVCGHIGYNPQIHGSKPRTFGKDSETALDLIKSAKVLEDAGAVLLVIEKVPEEIAEIISKSLKIPVIGIGSGRKCDGQVLVINDVLGISSVEFKHSRRFLNYRAVTGEAIQSYINEVENRLFPSEENVRHIAPEELKKIHDGESEKNK